MNDRSPQETNYAGTNPLQEPELRLLRETLSGMRYGSVEIVVQDGLIVQVNQTVKQRLRGAVAPQARRH